MNAGELRHWVTLQNPGAEVPDSEGGFTVTNVDLTPAQVYASIQPATARNLERIVANVEQSKASHIITIRYHPEVTTETRVVYGDRIFQVTGIQNPDERNIALLLACEEIVA